MKLSKTNPAVKALVAATFPEYRGRKFSAEIRPTYYVDNVWGGGTRYECKAVNISTGLVAESQPCAGRDVEIPAGVVIVEHTIFQGVDCGIRFYVSPADAPKFLPEAA